MSDDFIPLNQSTPVQARWQGRNQNQNYQKNRFQNGQRRGGSGNRWSNNCQRNTSWSNNSQRNTSFGSDSNSSFGHDSRSSIDAYLQPSMLEDPWRHLYNKSST